jgi:hypothetical protein
MTHTFKVGDRVRYKLDNTCGRVVEVLKNGGILVLWDEEEENNTWGCSYSPTEIVRLLEPAVPEMNSIRVGDTVRRYTTEGTVLAIHDGWAFVAHSDGPSLFAVADLTKMDK